MPADAWTLVREFALKAPPALVADVLLAALRQGEAPATAIYGQTPGSNHKSEPEQPAAPPVSAPPKRKPGRPPGKRARRARTSRRRSKAAAPSQDNQPQPNGDSREQKLATALTAEKSIASAFWAKADALDGVPWKLIADRFPHVPEALAQDGRRNHQLPRGISVQMAREFCAEA